MIAANLPVRLLETADIVRFLAEQREHGRTRFSSELEIEDLEGRSMPSKRPVPQGSSSMKLMTTACRSLTRHPNRLVTLLAFCLFLVAGIVVLIVAYRSK